MKFSTWTTRILFYPTVVIYLDPDDDNSYQIEENKNVNNTLCSADVVWGF